MADLTRTKSREMEAVPGLKYDQAYDSRGAFVELAMNGKVVIKDSDREYELNRQGWVKWYLLEKEYPDTVLQDWWVFIHDIKREGSGKHRHQGGLVLFIIAGHGATEVNGEIIEWHEGDCVMLPLHPKGLDHKHWNYGTEPAKWLAFIYVPAWDHVSSEMQQLEFSPDFQRKSGG